MEEPLTLWALVGRLRHLDDDGVGDILTGREVVTVSRPVWQWLLLVAGLYDREAVERSEAEEVDTRLLLLGLARLEPEFDALLRERRDARRLERDLGFPLETVLRPWARRAAPTELVKVWDLAHDARLTCSAIDPRGRRLATADVQGGLQLWDLAAGGRPAALGGTGPIIRVVAFSPDGTVLAAGDDDGVVRRWDLGALTALEPLRAQSSSVHRLRFDADGTRLYVRPREGPPFIHDLANESARHIDGPSGTFWSFSGDGAVAASGGPDDAILLWDTSTGEALEELDARGPVRNCALNSDGRLVAVARRDLGPVLVRAGEQQSDELGPHPALGCAFSPDDSLLAVAQSQGAVQLIDMTFGLERAVLDGYAEGCTFSSEGRLLVGWSGDGSHVWDVTTGRELANLEGGMAEVNVRAGLVARAGTNRETDKGLAQVWEEVARSRLPAVVPDAIQDEDLVGVEADADALADVIAATGTDPPLSIGLFGDWGSGKTFLIRLIQARVRRLAVRSRAASGPSAYCRYVRNVEFNAWQYAEGNLWASLVTHLFDELAKPEPAAGVTSRERAREQVARLEATLAAQSGVRERLDRAHAHANQAVALRALRRWTWQLAGAGDDRSLEEVEEATRDTGSLLRIVLPTRRARVIVAASAVLLAALVAGVLGVVGVERVGQVVASIATAVGAVVAWVTIAAQRIRQLVPRVGASMRVRDVQRAHADAELAAARAAESELRQELSDLAAGRRVGRFALERSESVEYRSQLSVVSRIHDDFERMSDLLAQQRERSGDDSDEDAERDALPRIDRIVLYIDDLDRCPPTRVVEVLEAVHLILALPLFVVVLAVDPRWLLRSLRLHYSQLLAQDGAGDEPEWQSTPLAYVEKIIQVPFALRPMNRTSARSLVHGLLRVRTEARAGQADATVATPALETTADSGATATPEAGPREEPAAAAPAASVTPRTLDLTPPERDFAALVAASLRTPRAIKKYTNLYRLLRARLDEHTGELDRFLDEEQEGADVPEYQAVLILVAMVISFPEEASEVLLRLLDPAAPSAWAEHVSGVKDDDDGKLAAFLATSTADALHGAASSREPFRRWALDVSRYSFDTGQEVYARWHDSKRP